MSYLARILGGILMYLKRIAATTAILVGASDMSEAEILMGVAGPLSGSVSYAGEILGLATEVAVDHLNEAGGVGGEEVVILMEDDACNSEQGAVVGEKLVDDQVSVVIGHSCSGATIAAMAGYQDAGIVMISPTATNPRVTDEGGSLIFRTAGRDDDQGAIGAALIAEKWPDANIALVDDSEPYGEGLASVVEASLSSAGLKLALRDKILAGEPDYVSLVDKLVAADVDVLYYGGRPREAALIIQEVHAQGEELQILGPESMISEDLWVIAGDAAEGILFTHYPDPKNDPELAHLVEIIEDAGIESSPAFFGAYAAIQAWGEAVRHAGTTDGPAVAQALRENEFDTVIGTIGFDDNGDVTGIDSFVWYVWEDGAYRPH